MFSAASAFAFACLFVLPAGNLLFACVFLFVIPAGNLLFASNASTLLRRATA